MKIAKLYHRPNGTCTSEENQTLLMRYVRSNDTNVEPPKVIGLIFYKTEDQLRNIMDTRYSYYRVAMENKNKQLSRYDEG